MRIGLLSLALVACAAGFAAAPAPAPVPTPDIKVDQVGYLPEAPRSRWLCRRRRPRASSCAEPAGARSFIAEPSRLCRASIPPPAKMYPNDQESYATNETAINWNAPLVFLLADQLPAKR